MSLIIPANTLASGGYEVDNSCRFDGSSSSLNLAPSSGGSVQKFTFSCWFKRCIFGTSHEIFSHVAVNNNTDFRIFISTDSLRIINQNNTSDTINYVTNRLFRDPSAWYHIVIAIDTTDSTAGDRVKVYVNGIRETSFSSSTAPSVNENLQINGGANTMNFIGQRYTGSGSIFFNGYMAEVVYVNGTANAVTDFGEFDEDSGIWKPIDVSGLTFGTNGFYLDFEDSAALGDDVSGNGNDFTVNNLTAIDQSTDTCTNNYCTLNPLDPTADITLSEGNLKGVYGTSGTRDIQGSTFGVSSGKWYWEIKIGGAESPNNAVVGVTQLSTDNEIVLGGATDNSWGYRGYDGEVFHNNSSVASYATFDGTSIIGIYLDLDNHKLYLSKDGALQSATGISLDTAQDYFPAISDAGSTATPSCEMNFGSPSFSISSGNTDANGYGNFEYSATITGDGASKNFLALNTKNLSEVLG
jgi:hypothetical protein